MSKLMEEAQGVIKLANGCDDHQIPVTFDMVEDVIAAFEGCGCEWNGESGCHSYCDREGVALVLLKDGRYASIYEAEDTSGHG